MKQFVKKQSYQKSNLDKAKVVYPRSFYLEITDTLAKNLSYFVGQELFYYNNLVMQLASKLKAYPQEILLFRENKSLWDSCAEHSIDPQKLMEHDLKSWPVHLQPMYKMLYDANNKPKHTSMHLVICAIAATPARLPPVVRKSIATEVMNHVIAQADILTGIPKVDALIETGKIAEGSDIMRGPLQLLQTHTVDSKRHLQIPRSLIKISYDQDTEQSNITVPYSKTAISVPDFDLTKIVYKTMVIRAPHPTSANQKWQLEFRDGNGLYQINMTDYMERKKGKR